MKHKLKATITFEYEVDSDYYDPCDLHNIIKTDYLAAQGNLFEFLNSVIVDKSKISIEPVKEKPKFPCSQCGLLREWDNKDGFIKCPCPKCGDETPF